MNDTTGRFWLVKLGDHWADNPRGPFETQVKARWLSDDDEKICTWDQVQIMQQRERMDEAGHYVPPDD